jgi:HTH-type transcriptional regulator / antitoxin HipB
MHPINHATQVGATLGARRKALGLSQTDVATRLGISQNRLSELESRPETLTVAQLLALLNVLGLEMTLAERAGGKTKSSPEW